MFADETKTTYKLFETYSKDKNGFLVTERRTIANKKSFMKVFNPAAGEYYQWSDGYENAFASLNLDMFQENENNVYSLKIVGTAKQVRNNIATQIYGNLGLDLQKFDITVQNNQIDSFVANCSFVSNSTNYEYEFSGKLLQKGSATVIEERAAAFEDVKDDAFAKMLQDLKGNNYSLNIHTVEGNTESDAYFYSTPTGIYYEINFDFEEYAVGFFVNKDGLVQEVEKVEEDFYKVGAPMDGDIAELFPPMDLSRACFELVDGKYVMKQDVHSGLTVLTNLATSSSSLDQFVIEIKEDSYVFTNTTSTKKGNIVETLTFNAIGTTSLPFSEDSLLEMVTCESWSDAIDSAESDITYEELTTTLGELILALPIPEGHAVPSSWVASSDEGVVLLLSFNVVADVDADIADFIQLLQDELDFDLTEAEGAVGGGRVLLAGPVEIDGQEVMFNIEVGNYDGFFFIAIYAAE